MMRRLMVVSCLMLVWPLGAAAQTSALPRGEPVPLQKPLPVDITEATRNLAASASEFAFTCRAGPTTNFALAILQEPARGRTANSLYWSVRATFRVAPFTTPERPLRPGECKLPRADFVDAPIVNLWRYLDTTGTSYTPSNGLQSVWMAPEIGVMTVNAIDPVFRDFIFRLSDSRMFDGSTVRVDGIRQVIEPGQPFEVRVTRMPCARNCDGFVPPSWEFYVVAAPIR